MKKKVIVMLLYFGVIITGYSQVTSTGLIVLDGYMSFKLDKDTQNSVVTVTLKGPSDRWFALGFNSLIMANNTDCIMMTSDTQLTDSYIPGALHNPPVADATNDWTLLSNTVDTGIRTIVATRAFSTGDVHDFDFSGSATSLDFIWAYSYYPIYDLYDTQNSGHGSDNYGSLTATVNTLGISQNTTSYEVQMAPNPAKDMVTLSFCTTSSNTVSIVILNALHQVVYQQEGQNSGKDISIPTAQFQDGIYYVCLKIGSFQSIKQLIIGSK